MRVIDQHGEVFSGRDGFRFSRHEYSSQTGSGPFRGDALDTAACERGKRIIDAEASGHGNRDMIQPFSNGYVIFDAILFRYDIFRPEAAVRINAEGIDFCAGALGLFQHPACIGTVAVNQGVFTHRKKLRFCFGIFLHVGMLVFSDVIS